MKYIKLHGKYGKGRMTRVEDELYDFLNQHSWSVTNSGYVHASINGKKILLHRFLVNAPKGLTVNHIDHNPLNNVRSNLEICTHRENTLRRKVIGKGAYFEKRSGRWYVNFQNKYIGTYDTEEEARMVYKKLRDERRILK